LRRALAAVAAALALCAPAPAAAESPELVTVTLDSAVATWVTAQPADSTVCIEGRCDTQERGVRLHRVVMDGLRPGTDYAYTLRSDGVDEGFSLANPGTFTTLTRPPGRHLLDFALMNDLHVGEGCAGTAVNDPLAGNSIPPCYSAPNYAERMDRAAVAELRARGIVATVVAGDVTAEARPAEVTAAAAVLGDLPGAVLVARGNHDRVHDGDDHASCPKHDCFAATFAPEQAGGRIYFSRTVRGVHLIVLDSVKGGSTGDLTDAAQNAWLVKDLAAHSDEPTFIAFHHPASEYADAYETEPIIFGVPPYKGGSEFLSLVADNPQVVGVLQAHTHRNFISYAVEAGNRTVFIENGTAKEYPGGYSVIGVYQGGYTRSYFRTDCAFCREWTETTRGEYFGLAPQYVLGSLGARNFTHVYDCDARIPAQSLPGMESLATGGVLTPPASCLSGRTYPPTLRFRLLSRLRLRCLGGDVCVARGRAVRRGRVVARVRGRVVEGRTRRLRVRRVRGRSGRARLRLVISNPSGDRGVVRGRRVIIR
jgi:hypothetical protein